LRAGAGAPVPHTGTLQEARQKYSCADTWGAELKRNTSKSERGNKRLGDRNRVTALATRAKSKPGFDDNEETLSEKFYSLETGQARNQRKTNHR
jgi:hypothetical protein